jgi:hypothetical protein
VPADGVLEVTPEPMSVPLAVPVLPVVVPGAPIEVPLPVVPAVVSVVVAPGVPVVVLVLPVVVSLGKVVEGVVVLLDDVDEVEPAPVSSRWPQADSDRAASRARAAHCAIGDLIIRNSLRVSFRARE